MSQIITNFSKCVKFSNFNPVVLATLSRVVSSSAELLAAGLFVGPFGRPRPRFAGGLSGSSGTGSGDGGLLSSWQIWELFKKLCFHSQARLSSAFSSKFCTRKHSLEFVIFILHCSHPSSFILLVPLVLIPKMGGSYSLKLSCQNLFQSNS